MKFDQLIDEIEKKAKEKGIQTERISCNQVETKNNLIGARNILKKIAFKNHF